MGFTKRLPTPLSERIASATAALYARQGREFDLAIGGIPFMLATMPDLPQGIETIKVRKDQFDTEDPGEQSLTGWWRRSQASFHEGAGNLYQESSTQNVPGNGFYSSSGIDVFTQGRLTLLKKMKASTVSGALHSHIRSYAINSVRTNFCTNPSAETNTTGWSGADPEGNIPTVTRDNARAWIGSWSFRVNYTGTDTAAGAFPPTILYQQTITPNTPYTASAMVWIPAGSVGVKIIGANVLGTSTTLTDQWVRLVVHDVSNGAGLAQIGFRPVTPPTASDLYYFDAVLGEEGTVLGDYFDGSSANSAWTGTAHASTSTQTITSANASFSAVCDGALHTSPAVSGTFASMHAPGGKTIVDGLIAGSNFYDVASDGTLYQGLVSSPGTATTWPCGTTPSRIGWGKHRLWVIGGRKLWQPDLSLSGGTTQNPIFTHPNQGWNYTCMAEGPTAMYFGGHDGFQSTIQAVTFDSGGGIPTLSGATVTAVLPDGELVQELSVVAGEFIGIGTNRGFRVGIINSDASITYGPLLVEPAGVTACTSMTAQSHFFVVGFRTASGNALAYRVDTSTELSDGIFPYASDIDLGFAGAITSMVSASTTQLAATASDGKVYYQSTTDFVNYGVIQSGRIRFRTTEPKSFKFFGVGIEPLQGNIAVSVVKSDGSALPLGSITKQGDIFTDYFKYDGDPMEFASVKLELTPPAGNLTAPVINSFLVKALPAARPQRLITVPLLCFDMEQARSGQRYGGNNFAKDRLAAMLALEDEAIVLTYQDFVGGVGDHQVVIESLRFTNTTPTLGAQGTGGILLMELRTVDA